MVRARRLYADLGNRRLKVASTEALPWASFAWRDADELQSLLAHLQDHGVEELRLASSSREGLARLLEVLPETVRCVVLQPQQVPLTITTTGTGIDRLLASWLAWKETGAAVLMADCGTAFTLDFTEADGRFLGGAIGAGLGLQKQALAEACPHLAPPNPAAVSGVPRDTAAAVAAGTYRAFAAAIEGLAAEFEQEAGAKPQRFLTGGDALELQSWMPSWQLQEHMVLRALLALPEEVWA